jgi:hypothetical protein
LRNVDYAKGRADQGCKNRKARGHSTMDRRLCPVQRCAVSPSAFFPRIGCDKMTALPRIHAKGSGAIAGRADFANGS